MPKVKCYQLVLQIENQQHKNLTMWCFKKIWPIKLPITISHNLFPIVTNHAQQYFFFTVILHFSNVVGALNILSLHKKLKFVHFSFLHYIHCEFLV